MSKLTEMADGTSFKKVIDESFQKDMVEPKKMQKVVLCSGQVYYDLIDKRSKINRNVTSSALKNKPKQLFRTLPSFVSNNSDHSPTKKLKQC